MATILRSFKYINLFNSYNLRTHQPYFIQCALSSQSTNLLKESKNVAVSNLFIPEEKDSDVGLLANIKLKYNRHYFSVHDDITSLFDIIYKKLSVLSENKNLINESDILMLIRCCGSAMVDELPNVRLQVLNSLKALLNTMGVQFNLSYYNTLLEVYLENETEFSPAEFLLEMHQNNVKPDNLTYENLLIYYCKKGNMSEANKLLNHLRENQIPIGENIFSALVTGNAEAYGINSALQVITTMTSIEFKPSTKTFSALLNSYAKQGDIKNVMETLKVCEFSNVAIMDKEKIEIIYHLAVNGHTQYVDKILQYFSWDRKSSLPIMDYIFKLMYKNQIEVAFKILSAIKKSKSNINVLLPDYVPRLTSLLLHLDIPIEEKIKYLDLLEKMRFNAYENAIYQSFNNKYIDYCIPFFKAWKNTGAQIKDHFFWPVLRLQGPTNHEGVFEVLRSMKNDFNIDPDKQTLVKLVLPNLKSLDQIIVLDKLSKELELSADNVANAAVYISGSYKNVDDIKESIKYFKDSNVRYDSKLLQPLKENTDKQTAQLVSGLFKRKSKPNWQNVINKRKLNHLPYLNIVDIGYKLRNYCEKGDVSNATNCINEIKTSYVGRVCFMKLLSYVDLLVKQDKIEDALQLISYFEPKEMSIGINDEDLRKDCLNTLNLLAEKGSVEGVNKLFNVLKAKKTRISKEMVDSLIKVHLVRNDHKQVLESTIKVNVEHQWIPLRTEVMQAFIKAEDVHSLQSYTDFLTRYLGRFDTILNLSFAFLKNDRKFQCQKLLESTDLQIKDNTLRKFLNSVLLKEDSSVLKEFIQICRGINSINRNVLYEMLLEKYSVLNNWKEGLALLKQIEAESFVPSDLFLSILTELLERNNQPTPFSPSKLKQDDKQIYTRITNNYFDSSSFPSQQFVEILINKLVDAGDIHTIEEISRRWVNASAYVREGSYKFEAYKNANEVAKYLETVNENIKSDEKAYEAFSKSFDHKCFKYFMDNPQNIPLLESLVTQMGENDKYYKPAMLLATFYWIEDPQKFEHIWSHYLKHFRNFYVFFKFAVDSYVYADLVHLLPRIVKSVEKMEPIKQQLFYEAFLSSFDKQKKYKEGLQLILYNLTAKTEKAEDKKTMETMDSKFQRIRVAL